MSKLLGLMCASFKEKNVSNVLEIYSNKKCFNF